ncbi:MAG: PrsW family intramembrane metalloprotease [Blautia sp.]|nr:PrsW family intramembrane metalloprotease [Blautia sp.]
MIGIIGFLLSLVISLCWYMPCVKAQGENSVLSLKDYIRTALVYGLLFSCVLIIITEIIWDIIMKRTGLSGLPLEIIGDFFRAALLEEIFKFLGFKLAKKNLKLHRKIDYMLIAGLIGLVYSVVEKAVLGNIFSIVVGLAIPMHIVWQLNQGGHYFEYEQHKAAGRPQEAKKEWLMAILLPFLFHGCWDSALSIASYCVNREEIPPQVFGGLLFLALVVFGVIYCVKTILKVRRIAKEEKAG